MSKSTVPLVSLALALAAGSAYLFGQLRTEHARAVALQTRVAELQRRDAVSPADEPSPPREPRVADTSAGVSQEPVEAPATSQTKPVPSNKCASPDSAELARQLDDPQVRATEQAYTRLELERSYPDLATALNLQPDEAGRLLDLLAKQEMDQRAHDFANDASRVTDDATRAHRERDAERRRQVDAERAALLGDAKLAEWNEYLKTLPARAEMRELRTMLAETSYPLRSDQVTPMVAALAAEQQRHAAERARLYDSARNATNSAPAETIQYMHDRLELVEQSLQRRHRLATAYLDTEQLKQYDEMLSLERRRAQLDHDRFVAVNQYAQREGNGR